MKSTSVKLEWARIVCVLAMGFILTGCAALSGGDNAITGQVTLDEPIKLGPTNAILQIQLIDLSVPKSGNGDAGQMIALTSQKVSLPPMPFELRYYGKDIDAGHHYGVRARILNENGQVLFKSQRNYPVITDGAPKQVDIVLGKAMPNSSEAARNGAVSDVDRDVAAIRQRLGSLRQIPGHYETGDNKVDFKAYIGSDGQPLYIEEQRDFGKMGKSVVKFYYRNHSLLRFVETAQRTGFGNSKKHSKLRYEVTLDFAAGRFANGTKTLNGQQSLPSKHEISGALAQSKVALSRIDFNQDEGEVAPVVARHTFACEDQSRFYVRFDTDNGKAIVEFLGREPLELALHKVASGYEYQDQDHELRGKGKEASWRSPSGITKCHVENGISGLALAPGNFPVVNVATLKRSDNVSWTHDFAALLPAVSACLGKTPGDLNSVLTARFVEHGMVAVRTINNNGVRSDCLVSDTGLGDIHTEPVDSASNILPGENDVLFTPASGAYPDGQCESHQRLKDHDVFIGWLSHNSCNS